MSKLSIPTRVGTGATELERRALDARLDRLGVEVDADRQIVNPGPQVKGGLEGIDATAGAGGVLGRDEVYRLPLTFGARFGGIFRDRGEKAVAFATLKGATQGLTAAAAGLESFATTSDPNDPQKDLLRLTTRLTKTLSDLDAVFSDKVLGYIDDPRRLDSLALAYRGLLTSITHHGDVALLCAGSAHGPLREAIAALLERQSSMVPPEDRKAPPIPASTLDRLLDSQARTSAIEMLRDRRFLELEPAVRERLLALSPDDALRVFSASAFHAVPASTRDHLLSLWEKGTPEQKANLIGLLNVEGFGKLASHLDIVEGLAKAGDAAGIAAYRALLISPALAALSKEHRALVLRGVAADTQNAAARDGLSGLIELPAFGTLSSTDQERVLRYFGGVNIQISQPARADLASRLEKLRELDPVKQKAELEKLVSDQPSKTWHPAIPPALFDKPLTQVMVTDTRPARDPDVGDATRRTLRVDGRQILLFTPTSAGKVNIEAEQVIDAISRLPAWSRRQLSTVTMVPHRRSSDPTDQGYLTLMDCQHRSSHVRTFDYVGPRSTAEIANDLLHESAHALAYRHLGTSTDDARWKPWHEAIAKDSIRASGYAMTNVHEDFAESIVLYSMVKGTPEEAELRAMMPGRFAILESLIAADDKLASETAAAIAASANWTKLDETEQKRLLAASAVRHNDPAVLDLVQGRFADCPPATRQLVIAAVEALIVTHPRRLPDLVKLVNYPGFLKLHPTNQLDVVRFVGTGFGDNDRPITVAFRKQLEKAPADEDAGKAALVKLIENGGEWALLAENTTWAGDVKVPNYTRVPGGEGKVFGSHGGHANIDGTRNLLEIDGHTIAVITEKTLAPVYRSAIEDAVASIPPQVRGAVTNATLHYFYGGDDSAQGLTGGWMALYWSYGERRGNVGGTSFVTAVHTAAFEAFEKRKLSDDDRARWKKAQDSDRVQGYSTWAKHWTRGSDFALHAQLYLRLRGTLEEASARVAFPERFALLDEIFARPAP